MLARLWKQAEEPRAAPQPSPATDVVDTHWQPEPEPLPPTDVANRGRKRCQKRGRIYHIYPKLPAEAELHARELLASIQQHAPEGRGDYVPQAELERYYEREFCSLRGWKPLSWVAVARRLRTITDKKVLRENGERFVGYRVPMP